MTGKILINKTKDTIILGNYSLAPKSSLKLSVQDFYKLENISDLNKYINSKMIGCYNTNLVLQDNKLTIKQDNTNKVISNTTYSVKLKVEDSVNTETKSTSKSTDEPTQTTTQTKSKRGRKRKTNKNKIQ